MNYPDYLVHFNKNHSSKNGQFTSGDGDGDGIADDHHNQNSEGKKKGGWKNLSKGKKAAIIGAGIVGTAAVVAGVVGIVKNLSEGKRLSDVSDQTSAAGADIVKRLSSGSIPQPNAKALKAPVQPTLNYKPNKPMDARTKRIVDATVHNNYSGYKSLIRR